MSFIKKLIANILVVVIGLCSFPIAASANIVNNDEVNDSINNGTVIEQKAMLTNTVNGQKYIVDIYETDEVQVNNNSRSNSSNLYEKSFVVTLDNEHMELIDSGKTRDLTVDDWDTSDGIQAIMTLQYHKDGTRYLVTNFSGTWVNHDVGGSALRNKWYRVGCNEGLGGVAEGYLSDSQGSFSIVTGFTEYADANFIGTSIGGLMYTDVYRVSSGHTWEFQFIHAIAGSMPTIPPNKW